MQLIGSITSPYVRRIRMLLAKTPYEFANLDIFSPDGRKELKKNNPAMKVPALVDNEHYIYDSRIIYRYLSEKLSIDKLSWQQENQLTLIDAANDSLVTLLLANRSGLPVDDDVLFFNLQHERVKTILTTLEDAMKNDNAFSGWQYPEICLFCLLDWGQFRALISLTAFPSLLNFWQKHQENALAKSTDPRLSN